LFQHRSQDAIDKCITENGCTLHPKIKAEIKAMINSMNHKEGSKGQTVTQASKLAAKFPPASKAKGEFPVYYRLTFPGPSKNESAAGRLRFLSIAAPSTTESSLQITQMDANLFHNTVYNRTR
jgi:hypothetical protein